MAIKNKIELIWFVHVYQNKTKQLQINVIKAGDHSRGWPEGSLFNSYYTKVWGRALLLFLDCSTLPLIRTFSSRLKNLVCPTILPIAGGRMIGFISFARVLVLYEMQSVSSRIWTRVTVSIFYDDNHYTTGTS